MNQMVIPAAERRRAGLGISTAVLATAGTPQPPRISIKANRFTLIDEAGQKTPLDRLYIDIAVVGLNPALCNSYYDEAYDPAADDGDFKPPVCYSNDGIAPDRASTKPQSERCAGCPQAEWGSKINAQTGAKRRACDQFYSMAVLVVGDPSKHAYQFNIKGGSFKNLRNYVKWLSTQNMNGRAVDMADIVTRVDFEGQGVLKFAAVAPVDEELGALMDKVIDSGLPEQITGQVAYSAAPVQIAAPAKVQQIEAPKTVDQKFGDLGWQGHLGSSQTTVLPPKQEEKRGRGRPSTKQTEAPAESEADKLRKQVEEMQKKLAAMNAVKETPTATEEEVPAFLRPKDSLVPTTSEVKQNFGMVSNPPIADSALSAALANAFALPTEVK